MSTRVLWILWIGLTLALATAATARLYIAGGRTAFLPGETHGVHHQIEIACETCHTAAPFASEKKVNKAINKTCVSCHKEELKDAEDSHPIKKFKNPRMAAYWEKIDGRFCTSCHMEHQPEITTAGLVTLPTDFCVACHSEGEQDVRVNRPSHAGLGYETCASSGCHNYHDNRALYEDFLVKHRDQPWVKPEPVLSLAAIARAAPDATSGEIALYLAAVRAPEDQRDAEIEDHWAASAHAAGEVGCAGCHAPKAKTAEEELAQWVTAPDTKVCSSCHRNEAETFTLGRHGMRDHPELAKPRQAKNALKRLGWTSPPDALVTALEDYLVDVAPPPAMSVAEARVTLLPDAHGQDMGQEISCNTCHTPHEQDLAYAAVESCLTCHGDDHSRAYKDSPHYGLWQAERAGTAPPGSGVSCASCHMPKTGRPDRLFTDHNQNTTLRPNEKMIRPTCMDCHSLAFAIDALADPALVENNFAGQPHRTIESLDWAVNRIDQPDEGANQ